MKEPALLLLNVYVAASAQCSAIFNETRVRVDVSVGSSLNLCERLTWTERRFKICWHFIPNGSLIHSKELFCSSMSSRNQNKDKFLNYTLLNITQKQSGWYFCRIHMDIPDLRVINCSGIHVCVDCVPMLPTENKRLGLLWLWITIGLLGLIVLILLALCVHQIRRRKRKESPCATYVNTHNPPQLPSLRAQLRVPPSSQDSSTPSPARKNYCSSKQRPRQQRI
ncbi:uncharacterized protein LOC144196560 [Stigmatopora nigra]